MKLTKKRAFDIAIELWQWLAESGLEKEDWPKWEEYGKMVSDCPFCEYDTRNKPFPPCSECPLQQYYQRGCFSTSFRDWWRAKSIPEKKLYARKFLEELKALR